MASDEASMAPGLARAALPQEGGSHAGDARAIEELIAAGAYREALAKCARSYAVPLGRLCMAFTGSQAESEELVQEALLAAYSAFPQYRAEGSVRAFLFGIARRICGRYTETRARQKAKLRLVHDTGRQVDAGELAIEKEKAERARTALAKLKPSEREALVLRYDAGLSFKELSAACGIDEAAARKRVSRALSKLRTELGEE